MSVIGVPSDSLVFLMRNLFSLYLSLRFFSEWNAGMLSITTSAAQTPSEQLVSYKQCYTSSTSLHISKDTAILSLNEALVL